MHMLKIGIFGVGHLGKFHINNWLLQSDVDIVGFYDPSDESAALVMQQYNLKRFDNVQNLINEIDAADIVAPTNFHYGLCQAALKAGKHVFVEKPLANSMAEAQEIMHLAKESNVKFQVGHVERFNPAYLAVQNMHMQPMFIEVHRLAQFNPRGTEVSVVLDLMIHDIDIILNIVKSDVKNISASGVAVMTETPDICNARIEFDNGCVANLTCSRISMKKMRKMRLFQKDAYIGIDFLDKKAEVIKLKDDNDTNTFDFNLETNNGIKTIAIANPVVQDSNAILLELTAFKNAIIQNTPTPVTALDGYMAMEIAHQILAKIGDVKIN
jgi:predicted dehydrogenase